MDSRLSESARNALPLVGLLAMALVASTAAAATQTAAPAAAASPAPVRSVPHSQRGERYYAARFGVDQLHVRSTASGQSVEFRYHVIDPDKAVLLSDKKTAPVLTHQRTGTKLTVPEMENVGSLRQSTTPQAGREYWMVFQNRGKVVKPGDKVDIRIGIVRFSGLYVE